MANNSDNNSKLFTDINGYLPDVYKSDVNTTVFDAAFNRHLTKDDTTRVAGFIGQGNPGALVDRQIKESTPHRQAFQLAPTMFSQLGSVKTSLSFKAFQAQLELMGVDIDRIQEWGDALQFNWIPPINIDMLINYQDYFWNPGPNNAPAQYLTIENRCNKALSKVQSYNNILLQHGSSFSIIQINYTLKQFVIGSKQDDLFAAGFIFYTEGTTNVNLLDKRWTVMASTYDDILDQTTITTVEDIALVGALPPLAAFIGQWWFNTTSEVLNEWTGSNYVIVPTIQSADISLTQLLVQYQLAANCACNHEYGWDILDFDTSAWDYDSECTPQILNQWSLQNNWIHKTEVQSFTDVKRAAIPILEYNSTLEMNEWVEINRTWKYRKNVDAPFEVMAHGPNRLELEPIKGYIFYNNVLYLFDSTKTINRDINYVSTLVPGSQFRVIDDTNISQVYTVSTSEYLEATALSVPAAVLAVTGSNYFITVVTVVEPYTSVAVGGGGLNARIEPVATSNNDIWKGYHIHWVLTDVTSVIPTTSRQWDYYLQQGMDSPPAAVSVPGTFIPQVSSIVMGSAHQEFVVDINGVVQVDLLDQFQYNPTTSTVYATAASNELRVYIDGIRQYANYSELTASSSPNYTLVGSSPHTAQTITYVTGVTFDEPLPLLATVRIEVGPAAFGDMGNIAVPVRTLEDETAFTLAVAAGTQPVYRSLTQYQRMEQVKTSINQYPLFNVYNVITGDVIGASSLFAYREDSSAPINGAVQRRIVSSGDGREYDFEQFLLDRDDNYLYGYRNTSMSTSRFWYNPLLQTVKYWDTKAWTTNVIMTTATGLAVRVPIVAPIQPVGLLSVEQGLWFDTTRLQLFRVESGSLVEITNIIINGADPSLQTVWKHGLNNERYVPNYVDGARVSTTIGNPQGDWEVAHQWTYNPEHHNRKIVQYSQLLTHFRTIIETQPKIAGLLGGGVYTLAQDAYNYGLGGTIKEYNDSYDTLISAVNVTNVTPLGVIDFASQEYAAAILTIRDLFSKSITETFTQYTQQAMIDLASVVTKEIIARYETNDFTAEIYADTSAFDSTSNVGIRNWISTAPMFGLTAKYYPHVITDGEFVQLVHHDGHRSTVEYTAAEQDRLSRLLCKTPDSRVPSATFGKVSSSVPPTNVSTFLASFSVPSMRTGVFWYRVGGGVRKLYRFQPIEITAAAPSLLNQSGAELPDGVMYYDTTNEAVYVKTGMAWIAITTLGSQDIMPLWTEVNFTQYLAQVELAIELALYNATGVQSPTFDYTMLAPTPAEQLVYDALYKKRFDLFVSTHNISAPFVNSTYNASNAFTWNYATSTYVLAPHVGVPPAAASAWQEVYTRWYGTPYPHLEPWKLQGFHDKPTWWDDQYLNTTSARRWIYDHATTTGMWENIRTGQVPSGRTYPDGSTSTGNNIADGQSLTTYQYFSVNISDASIPGGYSPDDLLPPYYDIVAAGINITLPTVRSSFDNYGQIANPSADYTFGSGGPVEWQWTVSYQHPYDNAAIAFIMQPVRFLHSTFGPTFALVDELQVETIFNQIYSHEDVLFHGDIYNTNLTYQVRGLNQWYVNFNRHTGYDTNGEFRELWAGWDPHLTYQFSGIIDTSTFEIANKYFDVNSQDYNIILANTGVIKDMWADAFEISLINIPPPIVQYNNQSAWKMEIDSLAAIDRSIAYYGTKVYPFTANKSTDACTAFRYAITSVDVTSGKFGVAGNQTSILKPGSTIVVSDSSLNDGTYTVISSTFEVSLNRTRIIVLEPINSTIVDGIIDAVGLTLPWVTGDGVVINSTKFIPAPLKINTLYYLVMLSSTEFKLAETQQDAFNNITIDLTSVGDGMLSVAEIESSFYVFGGQGNTSELWFHYVVDKSDVRIFTPPETIIGMQSLINIIDGYAAYQLDQGLLFGIADSNDFDPQTNRLIDWKLETERFIDWAFGLRATRLNVADMYPIVPDISTNLLTFTGAIPMWPSGTAVVVSTTGSLPDPLIANTPYYVVSTGTSGTIRLSVSANSSDVSSWVDITTAGGGTLMVGVYDKQRAYPGFELNPTRNNIWITTSQGLLSNVIQGPYSDIRVQQTIFDQYSRPLGADKVTVYREDKRSHIAIRPQLANDVDIIYKDDPYNYIHIGGGHFFVEGYEHYLILNDYTVGGSLVYDSFLGLSTKRFDVDYFEKQDYTLRPTLGGYYLIDQQFHRNIEGSVSDVKHYYDTMALSESTPVAQRSRGLLGYTGRSLFLDLLNVNSKSQFLFYKGMIQTKGSINSVKAYTNSRRFVDATIDEYWAWKLAEFGDMRTRVYPEIKLFSSDGSLDDVRLEFLAASEQPSDTDVADAVSKGFQLVSFSDDTRWNMFPEQKQIIQSPLFLDAEVSSLITIYAGLAPPPPGAETAITYWFNSTSRQMFAYDSTLVSWNVDRSNLCTILPIMSGSPIASHDMLYFNLNSICDGVRVLHRTLATQILNIISWTPGGAGTGSFEVSEDLTGQLSPGMSFAVANSATLNDGYYTILSLTYTGTSTILQVNQAVNSGVVAGVIITKDFGNYTTEIYNPGSGIQEYTRIDAQTVRLNMAGVDDVLMIFSLNPAVRIISPAKLVDVKAKAVIQTVPLWDPARGHHSPTAIHNVDLIHSGDPARYQFTPNPNDSAAEFTPVPTSTTRYVWNQAEVGTVWLDSALLGYMPYYDDQVFPNINDRLYQWGQLAPWSELRVFQWTQSAVPPAEWDSTVTAQMNNTTISQNDKATGMPRMSVFKRSRVSSPVTFNNLTNEVTVIVPYAANDSIVFSAGAGGTLPEGIIAGVKYVVVTPSPNTTFTLQDPGTEASVILGDSGSGSMLAVPAFVAIDWKTQQMLHDTARAASVANIVRTQAADASVITWDPEYPLPVVAGTPRISWKPTDMMDWIPGEDAVDVYINGMLSFTGLTVQQDGLALFVNTPVVVSLREHDTLDFVCPIHSVTSAETAFDPDIQDDGATLTQWKTDYQYSTTTVTSGSTTTGTVVTTFYYFWVENATNKDPSDASSLSTLEIAQQLKEIPTPHFVVQKPKDDPYLVEKYGYGLTEFGSIYSLGALSEQAYQIPVLYREAILRKASSYINDDDRYILRFTRDMTLRDNIQADGNSLNLKSKHEEWFLFRREQTDTIPQELWNRLTEALIGYKLTDSLTRVPTLDRELYDAQYGTDTRFGLGVGQTFVDKTLALQTIISYLQDPNNNFAPTDIDVFFATYAFDTPSNIIIAMNAIYNTFSAKNVNAMWFETLLDALSTRSQYREIMKTSWIALSGTRQLEINGIYDD